MTKLIIVIWMLISITLLMAGGNISPNISAVADIPAQACKVDKVYVEEDAELMWQDQAYIDAEDGAYKRNYSVGKAGKWNHAVNYCRNLNYEGYSDWRLPTSDELMHVHSKPGQVFSYFRGTDFWTSTPASENRYYAIYVVDAYQYKHKRKQINYIRCVRCLDGVTAARLKSAPSYRTR